MNNDYTKSAACKLMKQRCVCCGKEIVHAMSVEHGMGPECYPKFIENHPEIVGQKHANKIIYEISMDRENTPMVVAKLAELTALGFGRVAAVLIDKLIKVRFWFVDGKYFMRVPAYQSFDTRMERVGKFHEKSPDGELPDRVWEFAVEAKVQVYKWLVRFHDDSQYGHGPKGLFKIEKIEKILADKAQAATATTTQSAAI
jgi:hypothetical protein